jgi:hypothetical protein
VSYHYLTLERDRRGEGWVVYGHDHYPKGSVLEGQARRVYLDSFEAPEAARAAYPELKYPEEAFYSWLDEEMTSAETSGLPAHPPSWFDPADAGESWDEDY